MELGNGEFDQSDRCWGSATFGGGGHGEEGVGEHRQGGPSVPGGPATDLMLIQPGELLGGLEGFLDALPLPGHGDQGLQRNRPRCVAAVVGQLTDGVVAADQHMVLPDLLDSAVAVCDAGRARGLPSGAMAIQAQE